MITSPLIPTYSKEEPNLKIISFKIQFKFQNTAFLLVAIQIWIALTLQKNNLDFFLNKKGPFTTVKSQMYAII